MSSIVVLTATGAGTLSVAPWPAGTAITVENWGAGSGGSGTGSTNGGGGAGGPYASSTYTITPNDVTSGVAFSIGTGGSGNTGVGSVGGSTSFSTNNLNLVPNSVMNGAVVGVVGSGGVLPTGWSTFANGNAVLAVQVIGFGIDAGGTPYIDLRTSFASGSTTTAFSIYPTNAAPIISSTAYVWSMYLDIQATVTQPTGYSAAMAVEEYNGGTFVAELGPTTKTLTGSRAQYNITGTTSATTVNTAHPSFVVNMTAAQAIDMTFRIAGPQLELGSSPTFFKSTPGYTLALGGAAPITTAGGIGTATGSIGTIATHAGGSGAAYSASGSGGGGAAGKAGTGAVGVNPAGGAADSGSGGASGVANVEGGGGGPGSTAVGGTGTAGAAPGGGGGGGDGASGTRTGGAGGRGQIRVTFPDFPPLVSPVYQAQIWDH